MEEDLGLDKFRSVYNQAQAAADAAALSLQRADGEWDLRRHCHHVAQVVGKSPGKLANVGLSKIPAYSKYRIHMPYRARMDIKAVKCPVIICSES